MTIAAGAFAGTARFELRRQLGEGGFGIVYEAFDRERATPVALKVLRHGQGTSLYRFKREFRALADISHRNLVTLDELFTDGRHWFFTMELIQGETFVSYVRRSTLPADDVTQSVPRRFDEERLRSVVPQLVDALTTLHRRGIVHRDIKPSNVLVTTEGRVVVLDFGLVFEPATGSDASEPSDQSEEGLVILGTPSYMAPEQGAPEMSTAAADWYSVGVVLYESLTGQLPFRGGPMEQFAAKQNGQPRPPREIVPDVAIDLSDACVGLLEPDPDLRLGGEALLRVCGTPPATGDVAAAVPAPTALVGRTSHLDALADAFETASRGATVVALVSGASGMGKTALVREFLDQQHTWEPSLLSFTSRCYERETMPYKAVDPLVDALARHLQRLRDIEVARLLPRDAAILARVFPVLQAVDEIRRAPEFAIAGLDSVAVRQRAAAALRELLFSLAVRHPLVLAIDDAQWGDADSAAILQQVLRPPDAPPLLLIAAYRSEYGRDPPLVAALNSLGRDQPGPQVEPVAVGPLSANEARSLALQLTAAGSEQAAFADAIASESGGNPFFVQELARHSTTAGRPGTLDAVVHERVLSLPEAARQLMAAIALSAQPIPPGVAAAAIESDEREPLQLLRTGRLVRVPGGGEDRTLEPYHDRIREAVLAQISQEDLAGHHGRLAEAWERSGLARPETLATHFHGAGNLAKTGVYAVKAAERARDALAFDRAAEFYKLLVGIETVPAQRRLWQIARGDALVNAGQGFEAASSYLAALELASERESIDLDRQAAAELIRAGYLDEATAVLHRLLPKVGVRPPGSDGLGVITLLAYRQLIRLRGIRIRERPESEVSAEALQRIDVLVAIGAPLALISLPRGLSLSMQATWHALRAGERRRAAVGVAMMAASSAMGGTRTFRTSMRLVDAAKALAEPLDDPYTTARTQLAEGITLKVSGRWKSGIERLERAIETFNRCPGARWEIETAQTVIHDALIWTGDWRRLTSEIPVRRHDAEQRGDRYSEAHVAGRLSPLMHLAADRPEAARAEAERAGRWLKPHFKLQHRSALCTWLEIDLYTGKPMDAFTRLERSWPSLRGTLALFQNGRIEALFYRARIALALAAEGQRGMLERAARVARRLQREGAEWSSALALLVQATVAHGGHDDAAAVRLLEQAERALQERDMKLYAAAARCRRGRLLGGDAGRDLVDAGLRVCRDEQVANPARIVDLLTPGPW